MAKRNIKGQFTAAPPKRGTKKVTTKYLLANFNGPSYQYSFIPNTYELPLDALSISCI